MMLMSVSRVAATIFVAGAVLTPARGEGRLMEPRSGGPIPRVTRIDKAGCQDCAASLEGLAPRSFVMVGEELWLLNSFEPFLQVISTNGRLLREFGRQGQGPGEMNLPAWLGTTIEGEMMVYNSIPAQLIRLDPRDGSLLATTRLPIRVPMNLALHQPSGMLYALTFMFGEHARLDRVNTRSGQSLTILTDGDEYPRVIPGREDDPLESRERFAIAPSSSGGVIVGHAWEYRLKRYDPHGSYVGQFGRDLARPRALGEIQDYAAGAELPHFDQFAFSWDSERDTLWVRTYHGPQDRQTTFDLFDADGGFVGRVVVPTVTERRFKSYDVAGDILVTWQEEDRGDGELAFWRLDWEG